MQRQFDHPTPEKSQRRSTRRVLRAYVLTERGRRALAADMAMRPYRLTEKAREVLEQAQ